MKTVSLIEQLANVAHYSKQYNQSISTQSKKLKAALITKNLSAFKEAIGNKNAFQLATAQTFFNCN